MGLESPLGWAEGTNLTHQTEATFLTPPGKSSHFLLLTACCYTFFIPLRMCVIKK